MIIPAGFAQINAIHTGAGVPTGAQWTIGVDHTAFSGDPQAVAQAFETILLNSGLYANVHSDCDMTSVLVKFGPNDTGPSVLEPANEPGTGGTGGAAAPAFLIHKNTLLGGRAGRGRFFLPGVPETAVGPGGVLASGVVTAVNTALNAFWGDMATADLGLVLLHAEGSPITTPTIIESLTCDPVVGTQRRRQRR
jgi:hypothetical protein